MIDVISEANMARRPRHAPPLMATNSNPNANHGDNVIKAIKSNKTAIKQ